MALNEPDHILAGLLTSEGRYQSLEDCLDSCPPHPDKEPVTTFAKLSCQKFHRTKQPRLWQVMSPLLPSEVGRPAQYVMDASRRQ